MHFEYLFKGVCCAVRLERSACMLRWTQLGANDEVATPVNWKTGEGGGEAAGRLTSNFIVATPSHLGVS